MRHHERFYDITEDILNHPLFLSQKDFVHHHDTSLFEHAIMVSYRAFRIASALRLDVRSTARGALLHDFFLYDWHIEGKKVRKPLLKKHGFTHAKEALRNAEGIFTLNARERDIIAKHMFPLNVLPPRYLESWLVNATDTFVTLSEILSRRKNDKLIDYLAERMREDAKNEA